jgi:membrane-bound metal-dependent hydrolase YbcI (DUF457 family)
MPLTPFHIGPHSFVSLSWHRWLDVPIFVGVSVAIDIEPLLVTTFNLNYPLHGYFHTLLIGSLVGLSMAAVMYPLRHLAGKVMNLFRLPYAPTLFKMLVSGVLGAWLHILLDAPLYADIRPFYPWQANPLYKCISMPAVYWLCTACFVLAGIPYFTIVFRAKRKDAAAG